MAMGEIIKWGILAALIVTLIAMIFALPVTGGIDLGAFGDGINTIVINAAGALNAARGLVNNFTTPAGAVIITGLLTWLFAKFLILQAIKIITWINHYIFK